MDKLERLRKKLHKTVTSDSIAKDADKNVFDKIILLDFLKKMNSLGRFKSDDFRKLQTGFISKKYEWVAAKN